MVLGRRTWSWLQKQMSWISLRREQNQLQTMRRRCSSGASSSLLSYSCTFASHANVNYVRTTRIIRETTILTDIVTSVCTSYAFKAQWLNMPPVYTLHCYHNRLLWVRPRVVAGEMIWLKCHRYNITVIDYSTTTATYGMSSQVLCFT